MSAYRTIVSNLTGKLGELDEVVQDVEAYGEEAMSECEAVQAEARGIVGDLMDLLQSSAASSDSEMERLRELLARAEQGSRLLEEEQARCRRQRDIYAGLTETLGAQVNEQNSFMLQKLDADVAEVRKLRAQLNKRSSDMHAQCLCDILESDRVKPRREQLQAETLVPFFGRLEEVLLRL